MTATKSVRSNRLSGNVVLLLTMVLVTLLRVDARRGLVTFSPKVSLPLSFQRQQQQGVKHGQHRLFAEAVLGRLRGGDQSDDSTRTIDTLQDEEEEELGDKVKRAMLKLGLSPPEEVSVEDDNNTDDCKDGVCSVKPPSPPSSSTTAAESTQTDVKQHETDPEAMAGRLALEYGVDKSLAMAAIGATASPDDTSFTKRTPDEVAARELIQQELDRIQQVSEDSPEVQTLVSEGFDPFLSRRALAFAEMNMDDARAILLADQLDEEEDAQAVNEPTTQPETFKTVNVDANFDPTQLSAAPTSPPPAPTRPQGAPKPAKKSDVVFEATAATLQKLVLESPVPVLLDVYADWCGPCKALGPALEEMAVKAGGAFRLVKVNSDNERSVSTALEVTALPTVFGFRDGKILNMFQGMPRSEKAMQSFMMGLLMNDMSQFDPPVSESEQERYRELTLKVVKLAGSASFSFSARERLQERVMDRLGELSQQTDDFLDAEESARTLRSLLSNVIRDPYEQKFRTINLLNKVIAAKVAKYPACISILKSTGFAGDDSSLILGRGRRIVNVAPLIVARDCIDKWIDKSRYEFAAAARKRKDMEDKARLQKEVAERAALEDEEEEDEDEGDEVDPDLCTIKLRMDGKKKVHEVSMMADDPLRALVAKLPVPVPDGETDVQITCVARKLVIKSLEDKKMDKSLRDLGLAPAASLVVGIGGSRKEGDESSSRLSNRAASHKKKKKGSHTMQSVGIYSKDDDAKAELIDGGGGVWYEHDVTDDEEEEAEDEDPAAAAALAEVTARTQDENEGQISEDIDDEYESDADEES